MRVNYNNNDDESLVAKFFFWAWDKIDDMNSTNGGGGNHNDNGKPPFNNERIFNMFNWKAITGIVLLVLTMALTPMMFGINDGGHRTVVQYLGGTMETKFGTGVFGQNLGKPTVYNDVITFDFDKNTNSENATIDQQGISVQYQAGGMGKIFGILRIRLPADEKSMIVTHKEFRSNKGIAFKLIKPYAEGILNDTAGLMTSEQSYAEMRGTLTQWVNDQLRYGKYLTEQKEIVTVEVGNEFCLEPELTDDDKLACKNVRKTRKMVPVIALGDDGKPMRVDSDIAYYGLSVVGFEITDRTYEKKTMTQISDKREATMAINIAKANAERAKQDAITSYQQGLANVMKAKYEKEVLKAQAMVDATRFKEVAIINAEKLVEVARQQQLEQAQLKLAAMEYEQKKKAQGRGDAAYKKLVMEADGALKQKLEAAVQMNKDMTVALANRAVPHTVIYSGNAQGQLGTDTDVKSVIDTQLIKNLKAFDITLSTKK